MSELDLIGQSIVADAVDVFSRLAELGEDARIDVVNALRLALREHSPMKDEPVDCVLWVDAEQVHGNAYNPNSVAPPEMRLLERSIEADGYTQPIVAWPVESGFEVVDGFHRHLVGKKSKAIRKRVHDRLPVAAIRPEQTGENDRRASTIRHNRARGVHGVDAMSDLVLDLHRRGWNDAKIGKELGMEPDEVLRLKQVQGLAALFADEGFSEAWEVATPS